MFCQSAIIAVNDVRVVQIFSLKKMKGHFPLPLSFPAVAAARARHAASRLFGWERSLFSNSLQVETPWAGGTSDEKGVEAAKLQAAFTKDESQGRAGRHARMCVRACVCVRKVSRPAEHLAGRQETQTHADCLYCRV